MKKVIAILSSMLFSINVFAMEVTGAGASFPAPVYFKWAEQYKKETNNQLNYASMGSSGGIKQINSKTVDFGATDDPVKPDKLAKKNQLQFPAVMGAVVIIVNLDNVKSNEITLDGRTLGNIFAGKITKWNASEIKKLNPSVNLPDAAITIVHRSDGSGTTAVFTDYLVRVSDNFRSTIGQGKTVSWQGNAVGGKGNAGVSAMVKQVAGSIGYVEYSYAKQNNLTVTKLVNKNGKAIAPSIEAFKAAASNADWNVPGMAVNLNNQVGDNAWPITAATFIIVYDDKSESSKKTVEFFKWAFEKGDQSAVELDYVPLPDEVKQQIVKVWQSKGLL